jgi:hypothetical protein
MREAVTDRDPGCNGALSSTALSSGLAEDR